MIRSLKALGLALLAVFALGAVAAAGASAEVEIFDSSTNPTILTGTSENTQKFTTGAGGGVVECTHAQFEGTVQAKKEPSPGVFSTDTIEMQANYTTPTCTGTGGTEVHVDFTTGECGYHFTGTASKTAVSKLVCKKTGGSVTLTPTAFGGSVCTIHIRPQTTGGHVTFANLANGTVTAEATATAIESETTNDVFGFCGGNGVHKTGTYNGNTIITGYTDPEGPTPIHLEVT